MYYDELKNIKEWYGHTPEAFMAFLLFEGYVNNTIAQWERIQEDKKAFPPTPKSIEEYLKGLEEHFKSIEEYKTITRKLFMDVHSYFAFYNMARKLFRCFVELEEKPKLTSLWEKFRPKLNSFVKARDHMEHPCDRIIKRKYLADWCNIRGNTVTFGGKAFDIGKSELKILTDAYEEVVNILHSELSK